MLPGQNIRGLNAPYPFIKIFSLIAKPLTQFLVKDVPFEFTDACLDVFNRLKEA